MALALVATVGASTSNSYVTVAVADTYFEAHPDYTTWDALFTPAKERYLIQATRLIDREVIDGPKNDTDATSGVADQALRFPRSADVDDSAEFIPKAVQDACCEGALELSRRAPGTSSREELQAQGVRSIKIGDVETTFTDKGGAATTLPDEARDILLAAGFIKLSGGG